MSPTAFRAPVATGRSAVIVSLAAAAALFGCRGPGLRRGDPVPHPTDYRRDYHVKSMVIEPGHPLYDAFGGIHHVYANELARAGLRTGDYADGAVFSFDLLATVADGNAITEGARKVLGVMHKDRDAFPDTGGWGFAGFGPDGRDVVTDMQSCFGCHAAQKDRGYVFSTSRP